MKSNFKRTAFILLCVAPAVILFAVFMAAPTFNVFRLSLFKRSTFNPQETFVGLYNFRMLMKDATFIRSMQNMLLLIVLVVLLAAAVAGITALAPAGLPSARHLERSASGWR